jgi:hypothetical protein
MENDRRINSKMRPKALLFEDWFVCGKQLRLGRGRGKDGARFDARINERIFDKPNFKTVVWDGA